MYNCALIAHVLAIPAHICLGRLSSYPLGRLQDPEMSTEQVHPDDSQAARQLISKNVVGHGTCTGILSCSLQFCQPGKAKRE